MNVQELIRTGTKDALSLSQAEFNPNDIYEANIVRSAKEVCSFVATPQEWNYQTQWASGRCLWSSPFTENTIVK